MPKFVATFAPLDDDTKVNRILIGVFGALVSQFVSTAGAFAFDRILLKPGIPKLPASKPPAVPPNTPQQGSTDPPVRLPELGDFDDAKKAKDVKPITASQVPASIGQAISIGTLLASTLIPQYVSCPNPLPSEC
jgi:hypothetical protein